MNIKNFTHTDLDGVGCGILIKNFMGVDKVETTHLDYKNVNEEITKYFSSGEYKNFDDTYITDLGISMDVARFIDGIPDHKAILIDHHESNMGLNEFLWCHVIPARLDGRLISATGILYDKFRFTIHGGAVLESFAHYVDYYDTWNWEKYNELEPKALNDLFHIYGRTKFIDHVDNMLKANSPELLLGEKELHLLEIEKDRIDRYIKGKNKQVIIKPFKFTRSYNPLVIEEHTVGVMFGEQYVSETGNKICELHPEIDFTMNFNLGYRTIEFRTIRENIDLGALAKVLNKGGGHRKAAGCPISDELLNFALRDEE